MKKRLAAAGLLFFVVAIQFFNPVTRAETTASDNTCSAPEFENLHKEFVEGANNERVANDFLPYAVASLNAYRGNRTFVLANYDNRWQTIDPQTAGVSPQQWNGLDFSIFTREDADSVEVLVAFRGTDELKLSARFAGIPDWIFGNASWFTQWVPWWDQYRAARLEFEKIRTWAKKTYPGKNIYYTSAGHSLGGGLAQHIAHAFPCVRSVSFNSSCVTNEFRLADPYLNAQTVLIDEDEDPLSGGCNTFFSLADKFFAVTNKIFSVSAKSFSVANDAHTQVYGASNLISDTAKSKFAQHNMEGFSTGMSRMVLCCAHRQRLGKGSCSKDIDAQSIIQARGLFCSEHDRAQTDVACDFVGTAPRNAC